MGAWWSDGDPLRPTGDLTAGGRFTIDAQGLEYVVEDAERRPVLVTSRDLDGEARTRTESWRLGIARRPAGWEITARNGPGGPLCGAARAAWLPFTYRLRVSGRAHRLVLNPLTGGWRLTGRRGSIAQLSLDPPSRVRPGTPAGWIRISSGSVESHHIALLIVLALESIKAERAIPVVPGGGAGG